MSVALDFGASRHKELLLRAIVAVLRVNPDATQVDLMQALGYRSPGPVSDLMMELVAMGRIRKVPVPAPKRWRLEVVR